MKLFGKTNQKSPEWAGVFSREEYEQFRDLLLAISKGELNATNASRAGELEYNGAKINLSNLVRICHGLDKAEWDSEVERWVTAFGMNQDRPTPLYPRDISMLRLQLYPAEYFGKPGGEREFLTKEEIPGILTTIVVDWPDVLTVVNRDNMGEWAKHESKVRSRLLKKLAQELPHSIEFVPLNGREDMPVAALTSDEITAATHSLVLADLYPQLIGKYGALVGIPHRHMILVLKLNEKPSKGDI